jgi:hypothetical protein
MPKWVKTVVAVLLLPCCIGATKALFLVLRNAGERADTVCVPLAAGAACWLVIYLLLPKPMWMYVVGHELTHVIWTWAFGGRVKRFRASSHGGHVIVTKTNFFITLAPYFFPLYVVLVVLVFVVGDSIWHWTAHLAWFHLLLGAAYAFHVTLTWHALQTRQTDIADQGYLFSGVIILLGNIGVLLVGLPALTAKVDLMTVLGWCLKGTVEAFTFLGGLT